MPETPEPGAEWAGFHIESRIGSGGFGQVFAAHDPALDRRVAVKVIATDADPSARERFLHESRVAAELDHPGIVPILRVAEHDGVDYVVMAFVAGGDLGQRIHVSPLTLDRARSVVGQLGGALDRAHRAGLVHRGVEPANVLCAENGDDVYLADFGAPMASVHHAAPELVRGEVLTPATDVYALGCTLFECLTGRVPFPGESPEQVTAQHLESPPPRVTELRPDLPAELDDIVARAMAKDPADRHPTTRHLAEAVALVRSTDAAPTVPTAAAAAATGVTSALGATSSTAPVDAGAAGAESGGAVPAGRSVFDDTTATPATDGPDEHPVTDTDDGPLIDGAVFGIYEDERRRSRVPAVVVTLLVLAAMGVGALVWRAVNTDAELGTGDDTAAPNTPDETVTEPTVEALRALVPDGVDACVEPEGDAADAVPVVFLCPLEGVPQSLALELHASDADRDERFAAIAADIGVSDRDDAECALGRAGLHDYVADGWAGMVGCVQTSGGADFVWTRDDAPVLLRASGGGRFAEYESAWEAWAERTDAEFPTAEEQVLLDAIPSEFLVDCSRDLTLSLDAGGVVAAACRPPEAEPSIISWVLFPDDGPMDRWIQGRRDSLTDNNFDTTDDGCAPRGFGQVDTVREAPEAPPEGTGPAEGGQAPPVAGPPPDAAFLPYEIDGSSGRVLCFINTSGLNAVFWARDGSRIGSIAVSDRNAGETMADLLRWWGDDGYRP